MRSAFFRAGMLAGLLAVSATASLAQSVALAGMMGAKALVIVDGSPPKGVAVGETFRGIKIVSTQGDSAVMEIGGKRHTLRVGEAPASVGSSGEAGASGNRVVLTAGTNGHFVTQGQINGRTVQMLVDTGASVVSISMDDAERMGISYKGGQLVAMNTANGVTRAWRIKLASVKVGDVLVSDVDAVVSPGAMPAVLLGNSFLTRFQMTRTNDQMVLERRY